MGSKVPLAALLAGSLELCLGAELFRYEGPFLGAVLGDESDDLLVLLRGGRSTSGSHRRRSVDIKAKG